MKTYTMKSLFGKAAIAGALLALPVSTYALDASTKASLEINPNGVIRVLGAEVTSLSGSVINAVVNFKNSLINLAFTTNASTSLSTSVNGTATTSLSGLQAGDKINVTGTLGSFGSILGVTATQVKEMTPKVMATSSVKMKVGTVQSVNLSNGTFVLKSDDKLVTVQTNSSTQFRLGTTTPTLATLALNSKVVVTGTLSADGTLLTATQVITKPELKDVKKDKKHKVDPHKNGKGQDDYKTFKSKINAFFNW